MFKLPKHIKDRGHSGRFGYFDSHCRTPDGRSADDVASTAVMLTFFCLDDMIERLLLLFQGIFRLSKSEQFDLLIYTTVTFKSSIFTINRLKYAIKETEKDLNMQCLAKTTEPKKWLMSKKID